LSDAIEIEIKDPLHAHRIGQMYGQAEIVAALHAVPDALKLPGFHLALAIAEKELSELKSQTVALNMRFAAKAGHDLSRNGSMTLRGLKLVLEPLDLVDMANDPCGPDQAGGDKT
jgi:hypothetical protein